MNRDLFWSLVEPEHRRARAFCRKLTGNRDDGDDLYQSSLVKALTGLSGLRDRTVFRTWFYRIMINTFKNHLRNREYRRSETINRPFEENLAGDNPRNRYAARYRLEKAFRVLGAEDRGLITLFELEGWRIAELAALLGRREGAVKVRLSRIRGRMRAALAEGLVPPDPEEIIKMLTGENKTCVAAKSEKN
nr:RNA polymerase sigma factor [candidate division Zixibacteria bacterium]